MGTVTKSAVTIWYKPNYKHTSSSEVNLHKLPERIEFIDTFECSKTSSIQIKNPDGTLKAEVMPRVYIVKYAAYTENETENPDEEVDIMTRIEKATASQGSSDESRPKLHGFVLEGRSPYATGSSSQMRALEIAVFSGMPVVCVGRSDPGGRVTTNETDLTIEGSNLDANKARLLLMASMLKLGRLPKAEDPRNPTEAERQAAIGKIAKFQEIFETH